MSPLTKGRMGIRRITRNYNGREEEGPGRGREGRRSIREGRG